MAYTPSDLRTMEDELTYNAYIEKIRQQEYPMLRNSIYLDHAGTSLPNKTTLQGFHAEMLSTLHCNPHSGSAASEKTHQNIEEIRLCLLSFVNASPDTYDLVFVANATAGIKLVVEALRERSEGFSYVYHVDSHTSLVGARELAAKSRCVSDVEEVVSQQRVVEANRIETTTLFAYPAQSNMNGRRLPLVWCKELRHHGIYTMLDAAAYAPTSKLDLNDVSPDFTVLSLSKMFGFPDLGALIVRRSAAQLLRHRRYFGGGTVDMVLCWKEQWHIRRTRSLHEQLEDGSLPIHNIMALKSAMAAHSQLFGSLDRIAKHTMWLAKRLHRGLRDLKHGNGSSAVVMYSGEASDFLMQGPTLAFNLRDSSGQWISNSEVDKLASIKKVQLRTGGMCNPGGVAAALSLEPWELRQHHEAGFRCGGENDINNGKPTGVIRVSLGAFSTLSDVQAFLDFVQEYFVHTKQHDRSDVLSCSSQLHVESLTVYPVKSCAGWPVPHVRTWDIRPEGLAWDREWCIIHAGTGAALSQKAYPRMALIRPDLDFQSGKLCIKLGSSTDYIVVPLSLDPSLIEQADHEVYSATVCDDTIEAQRYVSSDIAEKLTTFLGVACTLARFPVSHGTGQRHRKQIQGVPLQLDQPLLLSNESPILTITRSSLNTLNEILKARGQRAAHHSVFRANIILSEPPQHRPGNEQPWMEDQWKTMTYRSVDGTRTMQLDNLGGCRRCQMVCVDQLTGERRIEIFLTLAKHRRIGGQVLFGIHSALHGTTHGRIRIGDLVETT